MGCRGSDGDYDEPTGVVAHVLDQPKLVFDGVLEVIFEVGPIIEIKPSADRGSEKKNGYYTSFNVRGLRSTKKFRYEGLILSDSVGHSVEIYEPRFKDQTFDHWSRVPPIPLQRLTVFDKDLNRWYK